MLAMSHRPEIVYNADAQVYLFWDSRCKQYYFYDSRDDSMVFSDRRRTPRPPEIPITFYQDPYGKGSNGKVNTDFPTYWSSKSKYSADSEPVTYTLSSSPPVSVPGSYSLSSPKDSLGYGNTPFANMMPGNQVSAPVRTHMCNNYDLRTIYVHDDRTWVQTRFATEPKKRIPDPALLRQNIQPHRILIDTGESAQSIFPDFKVRRQGFFATGRIFSVLWVEPAGESTTTITNRESAATGTCNPNVTTGHFNERIFSKVRRFVVIREGRSYCSTLPIVTYGSRGVGKNNVVKSEHAIIYSGSHAPLPIPSELPHKGELGMRPKAIRVVPSDPARDKLDPMCRIDFAKVHTIKHNIKVKPFGMVHANSIEALLSQFQDVWAITLIEDCRKRQGHSELDATEDEMPSEDQRRRSGAAQVPDAARDGESQDGMLAQDLSPPHGNDDTRRPINSSGALSDDSLTMDFGHSRDIASNERSDAPESGIYERPTGSLISNV